MENLLSPLTLELLGFSAASEPMECIMSDEHFNFDGYFRQPSYCGLDVFKSKDGVYVAIATEPTEDPNAGTSITNRIEEVAFRIYQRFENDHAFVQGYRNSDRFVLIEHYNWRERNRDEHFDLVQFGNRTNERFTDPKWYRINRGELIRLLGQDY